MVVSLDFSFLKYVVIVFEELTPILELVLISEMMKRCRHLVLMAMLMWAILPGWTSPVAFRAKAECVFVWKDIVKVTCKRERNHTMMKINKKLLGRKFSG
jgi:hypothetical protein